MKRILLFFVVLVVVSPVPAQDWKGVGRLAGKVTDTDGKPVPGAQVKFACAERNGEGPTVTADKNGKWAYLGLGACDWKIETSAEGYQPEAIHVTVPAEQLRLPPVNVKIARLQGPPPELLAAVKSGDEAFAAEKWALAREHYEKILTLSPELSPQVYPKLARTYAAEKNAPKAIEYLEKSMAADPSRMAFRFAAAQTALEAGLTEKGMEFLATIDDAAVQDSDGYFGIAAHFLRGSDLPNAITYFSKAIARDQKLGDAYYWRGMAYVGQSKLPEARADMEKVLELDPAGQYAEKARGVLEQLKNMSGS